MKTFFVAGAVLAACFAMADGGKCCAKKQVSAEEEFLAIAQEMTMKAEGKKACCKSTVEKPMAKGDKGCCNAKGEKPKFKVYVAGEGYKFFGCEGSAKEGRSALVAKGARVGKIQPTTN